MTLIDDPASILAQANTAWITAAPQRVVHSWASHPSALPRRHGPAVWITSLRQGPEHRVGIVVTWHCGRRGPLGDLEATLTELAAELDADALLLLTGQAGVRTAAPAGQLIHRASPRALRRLTNPPGTMTPTVEAACRFVDATGRRAAIGRLEQVDELLAGTAGTQVALGADTVFADSLLAAG